MGTAGCFYQDLLRSKRKKHVKTLQFNQTRSTYKIEAKENMVSEKIRKDQKDKKPSTLYRDKEKEPLKVFEKPGSPNYLRLKGKL